MSQSQAAPDEFDNNPERLLSATERQAILSRLALKIGLTLDLKFILESGLDLVMEITGVEAGEIFLLEGEPDSQVDSRVFRQVILRAAPEFQEAFSERPSLNHGEGFPGLVARTHSTLLTNKLTTDNRFLRSRVKQQGFRFGAAFPLLVNNEAIGSLNLFDRSGSWRIQLEDVRLIEELVATLALAISNAQRYHRLEQIRIGMSALSNAVEIVNTSLNPRHVLVRLLSEAVRLVGANGGAVYLFSQTDTVMQPAATILIDPEWREGEIFLSNSLAGEVLRTGTVRAVADTATTPDWVYPLLEDGGRPGSVVAAPLIRRGQLRGVLECYSLEPRNFSKDQLELFSALASHAVLALRNAELHQELETERRQADIERKKLRAILQNSPEGFFYAERDGTIVDFNQSARNILRLGDNLPKNFFQFNRHYEIYQPDGMRRLEEDIAMSQALQQQATVVLQEAVLRWPDGVEKNLLLSAAPIYDEQGKMQGAFSVFQDVTALKQAEKLKSKFLSMITHELKTPLASIKGTVSGLLQEDVEWDEASQKRFLHSIEDDVDGMVALVANLLDMARLEAGFMKPDLEECYLTEVAEEAARKLRNLARAAQQKIMFVFEPEVPPVLADFSQLERVLINLIGNALKYSPNNTVVTVSVRSISDQEKGPQIELAVADQGPGIPPQERAYVFKQFYRGQQVAGRTGRKVGTGLGLAICKEIISLHGGNIWVEDGSNGGAVFKFVLPAL